MAAKRIDEQAIFEVARKIGSGAAREAYLDQICGDDAAIGQRVRALLKSYDESASFLEAPAGPLRRTVGEPIREGPSTVIGPYKLMEQIGEGGMGLVFVAEQQHPVRRRVALKIIKPGMDSRQVIARFEAERQALAMMDHQNIAKVHDAGTTDSGRPYFVMELVHGIPITEYCDANKLTPRQRLELFVPVCQAVQHAHQKGIIHRDIKPSNILVTMYDDKPVPKVIDFGVAKAIEQRLTEKTVYTQFGTLVGTFEYMSPEQAEMNALGVDTRSDVYSLGVLLYELLTGTTPLVRQRLREAAFGEIVRLIKEEEPLRPSVRLSTSGDQAKVAAARQTDPAKLSRLVRGELDWVVMRCLEKDRSRRYETASGLAKDVQRYLADEAVEACPPSAGYRLRKFARKHKTAFVSAGTIAALLLVGIAISAWQAIRASNAENEARSAESAAARARDVARDSEKKSHVNEQIARDESASAKAAQAQLRRTLYASNLNLIQAAWEKDNVARVSELLEATRPGKDEEDLRGFEWHYWDRLCHPEVATLTLGYREARVGTLKNLVAVSADGSRCAAGFPAGAGGVPGASVKVWDLPGGKEVCSLAVDEPGAMKMALSGDGHRLAVSITLNKEYPIQKKIVVWDVALRKKLLSVITSDAVPGNATGPVLSRDGRRVAGIVTVAKEGAAAVEVVKVWDVDKGPEEVATIPGVPSQNREIELSPDGTRVAMHTRVAGPFSTAIQIRDVATGNTIANAEWPASSGIDAPSKCDMVFSPDGSLLAAVRIQPAFAKNFKGNQGVIWDVASGTVLAEFQPRTANNYHIGFSPDGMRLVTWPVNTSNPIGEVWDAATGKAVLTLKGQVEKVAAAAFSQDSTRLYSADPNGTVKVWDAADAARKPGSNPANGTARSRDGCRHLMYGAVGGKLNVVSVRDALGREILTFEGHTSRIVAATLSPDGSHAVSLDYAGVRMVWDTTNGKVLLTQKWPAVDRGPGPLLYHGVGFSDNSRRLVLAMPGGGVKVWNLADIREVFACAANTLAPGLSPDGRRVTTTPDNALPDDRAEPEVTVWDVESAKQLFVLKGHLVGMKWSPDGKRIAGKLRSPDMLSPFDYPVQVKVWDGDTGAELVHLKDGIVQGTIAFSPDSKRLATLAPATPESTGDILIWDVATGQQLLRLKGHGAKVVQMTFSPDGKRIASAANLKGIAVKAEIKLWDTATGRELLNLVAGRFPTNPNMLFFSSDGHRLLVADDGAASRVYGFRLDDFWDGTPRAVKPAAPTQPR